MAVERLRVEHGCEGLLWDSNPRPLAHCAGALPTKLKRQLGKGPKLTSTRHRGDSNPCGQSPMDFKSISLTARTQCHGFVGWGSNANNRAKARAAPPERAYGDESSPPNRYVGIAFGLLAAARKQTASREILLWMTPSEAPKALQASECSELLDPMRASCWISAQH